MAATDAALLCAMLIGLPEAGLEIVETVIKTSMRKNYTSPQTRIFPPLRGKVPSVTQPDAFARDNQSMARLLARGSSPCTPSRFPSGFIALGLPLTVAGAAAELDMTPHRIPF